MKIKSILFILCFFIASFMCVNCSTGGSFTDGPSFDENLVTKTWRSYNNGSWTGKHSGAIWCFTFTDCKEISNTEYQVIYEMKLYFYTTMPSTETECVSKAKLARAQCSNWNYNQITQSYKNNYISTLQNGTKFYRHKIKASKYADIYW